MSEQSQADKQDEERMRLRQYRREVSMSPCDNYPACHNGVWGRWTVCSECLRKMEEKK